MAERVVIEIDAQVLAGLRQAFGEAERSVKGLGAAATQAGAQQRSIFADIRGSLTSLARTATVAGTAVAGAFTAVGAAAVKASSEMQANRIAFETMLHSGERARALLGDLKEFAATTPFDLPDVVEGSKRLLAMGFAAEKLIPTFRAVGDAAAALGGGQETLQGIITALGQIQTKGKLSAEELNQLAERGVPAYEILREKLGLSQKAIEDMGRAGISSKVALEALAQGLTERFGGAMERLQNTVPGQMSNLRDKIRDVLEDIGNAISDDVIAALKQLQGVAENIREDGRLVKIFDEGATAARAFANVLREDAEELGKFQVSIEDAAKESSKAWEDALRKVSSATSTIGERIRGAIDSLALGMVKTKQFEQSVGVAPLTRPGAEVARAMAGPRVLSEMERLRFVGMGDVLAAEAEQRRKGILPPAAPSQFSAFRMGEEAARLARQRELDEAKADIERAKRLEEEKKAELELAQKRRASNEILVGISQDLLALTIRRLDLEKNLLIIQSKQAEAQGKGGRLTLEQARTAAAQIGIQRRLGAEENLQLALQGAVEFFEQEGRAAALPLPPLNLPKMGESIFTFLASPELQGKARRELEEAIGTLALPPVTAAHEPISLVDIVELQEKARRELEEAIGTLALPPVTAAHEPISLVDIVELQEKALADRQKEAVTVGEVAAAEARRLETSRRGEIELAQLRGASAQELFDLNRQLEEATIRRMEAERDILQLRREGLTTGTAEARLLDAQIRAAQAAIDIRQAALQIRPTFIADTLGRGMDQAVENFKNGLADAIAGGGRSFRDAFKAAIFDVKRLFARVIIESTIGPALQNVFGGIGGAFGGLFGGGVGASPIGIGTSIGALSSFVSSFGRGGFTPPFNPTGGFNLGALFGPTIGKIGGFAIPAGLALALAGGIFGGHGLFGGSGILGIEGFPVLDDPVNDAAARRSGRDFAKHFMAGLRDENRLTASLNDPFARAVSGGSGGMQRLAPINLTINVNVAGEDLEQVLVRKMLPI